MDEHNSFKVAVIAFVHVGHMNPLLAMVKELVDRGVDVIFFGDSSVKQVILKAGARYMSIYDGCFDDEEVSAEEHFMAWREKESLSLQHFHLFRVQEASRYMVPLMRNLKLENPDAILHDTFCVEAFVLSKILKIPLISHISYSGMGILGDKQFRLFEDASMEELMNMEPCKKWREIYLARYHVDIWEENLPMQYYSKDLVITTMIEDLCLALNPVDDPVAFGRFKQHQEKQVFVGPCFNESLRLNGKPTALAKNEIEEDSPVPIILRDKALGKKIVLVSLGTVITQNLWESGDQFPVGGIGSGKDFYTCVIGRIVEALGGDERITVVLATGMKANGIESDAPLPSNFILRKRLAQTKILKLTDCFISHMGANSMNEALDAGVPLVPMPGFADQMTNGKLTINAGAAYAEWDQDKSGVTCTVDAIKRAVSNVLDNPVFAANSKRLGEKNRNAGGAKRAAEVMIRFISKNKATSGKVRTRILQKAPSSCAMETPELLEEPVTNAIV